MKKDFTQKTLWTGLMVSTLALTLHTTGAMPMDGLNPLNLPGCASTSSAWERPIGPANGVKNADIALMHKSGSKKRVPRGAEIIIKTTNKEVGPVRSYGVSHELRLVYVATRQGEVLTLPFDSIKEVQVIDEGMTAGAGARSGTMIGGFSAGFLGLFLGGDAGLCAAILAAPVGMALGAGTGAAVAGASDNNEELPINANAWGFDAAKKRAPAHEAPISEPPAPAETPAVPAKKAGTADAAGPSTTLEPAAPTDAPAEPK